MAVFKVLGGAGGSATSSKSSTVVATKTSSSASSTVVVSTKTSSVGGSTTTAKVTATPTATGTAETVAEYGQCGGIGYVGATVCASPFTCNVENDCELSLSLKMPFAHNSEVDFDTDYSQCL